MRYSVLFFVIGISAFAQTWTPPRASDGHPDLEGFWSNNNATPLERPKELAGRATLTDAELAAMKAKAHELFAGDADAAFGDNVFLAAAARERQLALGVAMRRPAEGPEDRSLSERCIACGTPQLTEGYRSYYQIVQTRGAVVIMTEMIHDARVIPLDDHPHPSASVHQWTGDSSGHWEGDTLVIDTTNYKPRAFRGISSEKLHTIERISRTAPGVLTYEIKVDDPGTWTKPWSLMIPLRQSPNPVYEYACHEGNEGLRGILAGARADEAAAKLSK